MKTEQMVAQTATNPTEASSLPAEPAKVSVAKVHQAKDIPAETLWTAHTIGGVLFLFAVVCIVFAKGPTRKQALEAMNQTK